ncbi:hypothetical protein CEXT_264061 [Caerostris extrusa]|uniref:Uncharacterized protein n=1 Tax=Caerostris extrusa TaxID=172846 RepID=A0AAV4VMU2_CAEEX|nr:hypothetical protein CEXT_264061 [Caerostris extrusa]
MSRKSFAAVIPRFFPDDSVRFLREQCTTGTCLLAGHDPSAHKDRRGGIMGRPPSQEPFNPKILPHPSQPAANKDDRKG